MLLSSESPSESHLTRTRRRRRSNSRAVYDGARDRHKVTGAQARASPARSLSIKRDKITWHQNYLFRCASFSRVARIPSWRFASRAPLTARRGSGGAALKLALESRRPRSLETSSPQSAGISQAKLSFRCCSSSIATAALGSVVRQAGSRQATGHHYDDAL